ncbi:MAG: nucleotidyltransferase family protein [Saccharofermentans sp.]|nr:nucleotidyltransferase family protein [Saccharofermentans sp.]
MRVIGIIAEFNPFHNGHKYLIEEARRRVNDPRAIVMTVMSGAFVQRGFPSVLPKHERARMALLNGADVAIEIPFTFACSPSERFARGSVELLYRTGVVTDLAFGVDCQKPELLFELADIEPDEDVLKSSLASGNSFPSARAEAVISMWTQSHPDASSEDINVVSDTLRQPNSILALDYIRAVRDMKINFKIHLIPRIPDSSATSVREKLMSATTTTETANSLMGTMPDNALAVWLSAMSNNKFTLPMRDNLAKDIYLRIKTYPLNDVAYMSDGLDGYITNTLERSCNFINMMKSLQTKHFTMPRIRRALSSFLVGQKADYIDQEKHVQYIRVLGFSREGRYCLKVMGKCARLPIIHNPSDALELYASNPRLKAQFELDLQASRVQAVYLGMDPDYEWSQAPIVVK